VLFVEVCSLVHYCNLHLQFLLWPVGLHLTCRKVISSFLLGLLCLTGMRLTCTRALRCAPLEPISNRSLLANETEYLIGKCPK
jgi:hypothetical protein